MGHEVVAEFDRGSGPRRQAAADWRHCARRPFRDRFNECRRPLAVSHLETPSKRLRGASSGPYRGVLKGAAHRVAQQRVDISKAPLKSGRRSRVVRLRCRPPPPAEIAGRAVASPPRSAPRCARGTRPAVHLQRRRGRRRRCRPRPACVPTRRPRSWRPSVASGGAECRAAGSARSRRHEWPWPASLW